MKYVYIWYWLPVGWPLVILANLRLTNRDYIFETYVQTPSGQILISNTEN